VPLAESTNNVLERTAKKAPFAQKTQKGAFGGKTQKGPTK